MALSASSIIQIQSTAAAANVNAGYFNPANANMATDLTTDSNTANTDAPVCSSASYNFVAGDAGHYLYIKSGTNWTPGWYLIASVGSNKATLTATVGTAEQDILGKIILNTVSGCATVGTPTSGTWTIDYSRSDTSPFASTDLASLNGTTNPSAITSAANPFTIAMVGNGLHVTAGTSWTSQWMEIVSVSVITATMDKAAGGTATLTSGTGKVGGALSLGSSTSNRDDQNVFNLGVSSTTAATRFFIKGGSSITYTVPVNITQTSAGNAAWSMMIEGYNSVRGDRPTGATRPTLAIGSTNCILGTRVDTYCLAWTGTADLFCNVGSTSKHFYSKYVNTSTTATQRAVLDGGSNLFVACEFISYRGVGLRAGNGLITVINCSFHDSNVGLNLAVANAHVVIGCIFSCNVAQAINISTAVTVPNCIIMGNTFYGTESKLGVGINFVTASRQTIVMNNIFYGFATGITHPDVQFTEFDDYNDFYNNTADVSDATHWFKGVNDKALDPTFTSITQRTGTTATTTAGNHLVQTGATFQTWAVTTADFLYVASGTGPTAGIYSIASVDSETQITTTQTLTANATGDKTWFIIQGRNFAIGTNLKALGYPGVFPGALTTGYTDIGAAQRQEAAAGGSGGGTVAFAYA